MRARDSESKWQTAAGFWRAPIPQLLRELATAPEGLAPEAAAARLAEAGPNLLAPRRERALVLQLLARFRNPLVLLLLAASAVSAATGDVASFAIIATIVVASVLLDFVQEQRAGRAAERLRESVAVRVTVVRGGAAIDVPAAGLVPGDVVQLAGGDLVPADLVLLESRDLFVNQALLTGEPFPVEKSAAPSTAGDEALAEASNALFMGSSVVSGNAHALVCRTGARTALGEIGISLQSRPPETSFEHGTRDFGLLILRLAMGMVLFVILVNLVRGRPLLETFLFAIALAVGLTPELLPMIVSVTLARGALRMAAKRVIVKRLASILDLGAMDVLCTDKTGTLTEAKIRLERHLSPAGLDSPRTLELVYLNSFFQSGLRNPLDDAVLRHEEIDVHGWEKLDEVPFDFERRRVAVLVRKAGGPPLLVVKGALEDVLECCDRLEGETEAELRSMGDEEKRAARERFAALSREGFRVLGVAWKDLAGERPDAGVADETGLVFAGFAAFEDPPKASAALALKDLASRGVELKVVTGDNELVTQHLCAELDLPVTGVLTGAEIQQLDDTALQARVAEVNLFCRVPPAAKNRVLLALKARGHTVGYLGDGINDAPSLHSADVGVSVEGGVDVAKAAADLILLDRDLMVLRDGVLEGRQTFANILKYILMGTSSNFGNMFSMAAASMVLPFLPMLPAQVLLNNLLYDVSEIPIPMDSVDAEAFARPRRWDMKFIRRFMFTVGPVSSLFDFLTFAAMLGLFHADAALFHTGWFVESMATQVLVIFIIRTRRSPFASRPSRLLVVTSVSVVAIALFLPFAPFAARLGFTPPPIRFFLFLAALVAAYLAGVELVKRYFYRHVTAER